MNTAYPYADGKRLISQRTVGWTAMRRITLMTSLLFFILGGLSIAWAKSEGQQVKVNPYLHRTDVSIYFGSGGFYFGVPYGPVYVQPHFHFRTYPKFFGRHGHHKKYYKPSRKFYRYKDRSNRHRGHGKKGRHGGRHHQKHRH